MAETAERFEPVTGARRLHPGEECTSSVAAKDPWAATGLFLGSDEEYVFTASGQWIDKTYTCGPEGYASPNWMMRAAERFRRVPAARWFALVGTVGRDRRHAFVIGSGTTVRIATKGVLLCFANDVPGFYGNNRGSVTLTVRRLR